MARRDQPYIPLFADDFQTDEKLAMCSAESTGVLIRIMCLMHKSDPYGTILLKQKFKQTAKQISNFASQLAIYFPYDTATIERSLSELIDEDVLQLDGDFLTQKRMVKDGQISDVRSGSGKKGGETSAKKRGSFASDFAQANVQPNAQANSVIEYESGNGIGSGVDQGIGGVGERGLAVVKKNEITRSARPQADELSAYFSELGFPQEAEKFFDYYTSNGWKVGRNAMKDWKATARNWVRKLTPAAGPPTDSTPINRHTTHGDARRLMEWAAEQDRLRNEQTETE